MDELALTFNAILLLSLRIVPVLAFAQPFTLMRVPPVIRVLLAAGLALALVGGRPEATLEQLAAGGSLITVAAGELMIGVAIALAMQIAFGAILWAGAALDIQAGYGLAMVADPTTQAQMPLAGTVYAYVAAALFFASGGMFDLLALWALSLDRIPMNSAVTGVDISALLALLGSAFVLSMALVALVMLVLFLLDLAIAFMSRTLPQMNVLLLGFQVKAMATLAVLPIAVAVSGAVSLRIIRLALESAPRLLTVGGN
jgi:flagellar biosynthesis protein FliR